MLIAAKRVVVPERLWLGHGVDGFRLGRGHAGFQLMTLGRGSELRDGALVRGWARWWVGECCGVGEVFGEVAGDFGEGVELGIDGGFLIERAQILLDGQSCQCSAVLAFAFKDAGEVEVHGGQSVRNCRSKFCHAPAR